MKIRRFPAIAAWLAASVVGVFALEDAQSPYLRQYADHPIDWHPWTDATLAAAREADKPIFLSIGYLTCRGCRVMNTQTFLQPEIYTFLNEHFINILVDREERPDIDRLYQAFVAGTTGRGGWPLNVWLTPDLQPYMGGTFFPPQDRPGQRGLLTAARIAARGWTEDRHNVVAHAQSLTDALHALAQAGHAEEHTAGPAAWTAALDQLQAEADTEYGGFGDGPKFPHALKIRFLFRLSVEPQLEADQRDAARDLAFAALRAVVDGALHDREHGGFHRYAVDREWQEPHYEKMLYDQAWISQALLDAWQLSHEARWADAARGTFDFVLQELVLPNGTFASSFNAQADPDQPLLDDKVVTAWNGYMMAALARGARVLGEERGSCKTSKVDTEVDPPENEQAYSVNSRRGRLRPALMNGRYCKSLERYLDAAARAGRQLREQHDRAAHNRLARLPGGTTGFAEDYAGTIQAALALFEATLDPVWLDWARRLQAEMNDQFGDEAAGGYFSTAPDDPQLLVRMKESFDDAEPAASSLAAANLLRLASLTGDPDYREQVDALWPAFAGHHQLRPAAMPLLLTQTMVAAGPSRQLVIAGALDDADAQALLDVARKTYLPDTVIMVADPGAANRMDWPDYIREMTPIDGQATAYACEDFVCHLPVHTPEALTPLLRNTP